MLLCFLQRLFKTYTRLSFEAYRHLKRTIPGFDKVVEKVAEDSIAKATLKRNKKEMEERVKAEDDFIRAVSEGGK